ncbi:hypothetical protein OEA41_009526 [Lepraria neglecta]|uniref:Uncharacterized protein n=1 Tax=Lepraria neglecta TaxID=209136 RepID=A0AAE0DI40_9LECA|nr:hypothetical protein OEA41_009526 [Lepraria neglecta]
MAHYGKKTGDVSIQVEACRWYDKGLESQRLESQRTQLQLLHGDSVHQRLDAVTISAPLMFSVFESMMSTSFAAWSQHVKAAGKMIEMRGPENCQSGLIHHLFRTVRIGAIYMGMTFERPSVFASEEWCRIPFLKEGKNPMDRLGDVLLQYPSIFIVRNSMREMRSRGPHRLEPTRQAVEAKAEQLISLLDTYWNECRQTIQPGYDHDNFAEIENFRADTADWVIKTLLPITYKDIFAATNVAMYDAAVILAHALAWESTSGFSEPNKQRIVIHCASILEAVKYHESKGPSSGGSISMVLPIKVVRRATPSKFQREQAQVALEQWADTRGVDGICKFPDAESEGFYGNICKMEAAKEANDASDPNKVLEKFQFPMHMSSPRPDMWQ